MDAKLKVGIVFWSDSNFIRNVRFLGNLYRTRVQDNQHEGNFMEFRMMLWIDYNSWNNFHINNVHWDGSLFAYHVLEFFKRLWINPSLDLWPNNWIWLFNIFHLKSQNKFYIIFSLAMEINMWTLNKTKVIILLEWSGLLPLGLLVLWFEKDVENAKDSKNSYEFHS